MRKHGAEFFGTFLLAPIAGGLLGAFFTGSLTARTTKHYGQSLRW